MPTQLKMGVITRNVLDPVETKDITPFLDSVTGTGPFTFNYHIVIGGGELVQPGPGTAPPAVTAANGSATGGAVFSDYFTVYDFNGYNGTHTEPGGWALSVLGGN